MITLQLFLFIFSDTLFAHVPYEHQLFDIFLKKNNILVIEQKHYIMDACSSVTIIPFPFFGHFIYSRAF